MDRWWAKWRAQVEHIGGAHRQQKGATRAAAQGGHVEEHMGVLGGDGHGCIRREGASEAAPEAVS